MCEFNLTRFELEELTGKEIYAQDMGIALEAPEEDFDELIESVLRISSKDPVVFIVELSANVASVIRQYREKHNIPRYIRGSYRHI